MAPWAKIWRPCMSELSVYRDSTKTTGGRIRLTKFKFSANFHIGLHVILQLQIKKIKKCLISYVNKYFNRKSVEVQRWTPLEVIQNEFCLWITVRCMQRSGKSVLPHWIRLYLPPLNFKTWISTENFNSLEKSHPPWLKLDSSEDGE